jgi:hypothetical protein
MSVQRAPQSLSKKSYITTSDYSDYFYSYTIRTNPDLTKTGVWSVASGDIDLSGGDILRENGKRLIPGIHPDVDQLYVGVYDAKTFRAGYINPNDIVFQVYNEDKPYFLPNATGHNPEENTYTGVGGGPTITYGNVRVIGGANSANGGNVLAGADLSGSYSGGGEISLKYLGTRPGNPPTGSYANYASLYSDGANFPAIETGCDGNGSYYQGGSNTNTGSHYAGFYGNDGSVYFTGNFQPYNAKGTNRLLAGTTGPITINPHVALATNTVILITRNTYTGSAIGVLTYTINTGDHSITITSKKADGTTETGDEGMLHYLVCGN